MKIQTRLMLGFSLISACAVMVGLISLILLYQIAEPLRQKIPASLLKINKEIEQAGIYQSLRYYYEIQTQSVRDYVYTEEMSWQQRYFAYKSLLQNSLQEALNKFPENDHHTAIFQQNSLSLYEMNTKIFQHLKNGQKSAAEEILLSPVYQQADLAITNIIQEFFLVHGGEGHRSAEKSFVAVKIAEKQANELLKYDILFLSGVIIVLFLLSTLIGIVIIRSIALPLNKVINANLQFTENPLNGKYLVIDDDDPEDLKMIISTRNTLMQKLDQAASILNHNHEQLENEVVKRTENLTVAYQELQIAEERLSLATRSAKLGIWDWNIRDNVLFWDSSMYGLYGITPDTFEGVYDAYIKSLHPEDVERCNQKIAEAIEGKSEFSEAFRVVHPNGAIRYIQAYSHTYRDEHKVAQRMIGINFDFTQQKIMEQELRSAKEAAELSSRAKADFLATMSHEIRTPMNGVLGMTALLQDTGLNSEQQEYLDAIRSSGESLLTIINDILDFSKFESGQLELEDQSFSIHACIEEILDLLSSSANKKMLELMYLVNSQVPSFIVGDITRLRQILINLVSNAIKFTHQGEIYLYVSRFEDVQLSQLDPKTTFLAPQEFIQDSSNIDHKKDLTLLFSIVDTGIGMSLEQMERLFKPFAQADSSTTRKFGGTGLGLAICARLVSCMGGRIWVQSQAGQGSTFNFTLNTCAGEKIVTEILDQSYSLAEKKILIVDDNATNRVIMTRLFEQWQYKPTVVASGEEALNFVGKDPQFDVIIIDMRMPEMNGVELALRLKEHETTRNIPLILLTAALSQLHPKHRQLFAACENKPIKSSALYNLIQHILTGSDRLQSPQPAQTLFNHELSHSLPLNILIAEDNHVNQKLILRMLEKIGYRAELAANGLEAIAAVALKTYDILFMDVQMPEMDGYEATRQIIANTPPQNRPKIIAMTANAMQGDRELCLEAGMDDYISKPISPSALQNALENWGGQKQAEIKSGKTVSTTRLKKTMFDESIAKNLLEEGVDFFNEITDIFIKQGFDFFEQITVMTRSAQSLAELKRSAHKIKGASLSIGATHFAEICEEIEEYPDDAKLLEHMPSFIERLNESFAQTQSAMIRFQQTK